MIAFAKDIKAMEEAPYYIDNDGVYVFAPKADNETQPESPEEDGQNPYGRLVEFAFFLRQSPEYLRGKDAKPFCAEDHYNFFCYLSQYPNDARVFLSIRHKKIPNDSIFSIEDVLRKSTHAKNIPENIKDCSDEDIKSLLAGLWLCGIKNILMGSYKNPNIKKQAFARLCQYFEHSGLDTALACPGAKQAEDEALLAASKFLETCAGSRGMARDKFGKILETNQGLYSKFRGAHYARSIHMAARVLMGLGLQDPKGIKKTIRDNDDKGSVADFNSNKDFRRLEVFFRSLVLTGLIAAASFFQAYRAGQANRSAKVGPDIAAEVQAHALGNVAKQTALGGAASVILFSSISAAATAKRRHKILQIALDAQNQR